ncbi:unnamed protein product [Anisakis simplex]|uniref:Tetratricopeptide repeat protein 27 (inferred by orthology to a human protein) n=1 Tax=Anisakis simplex TaxID=6269 RepID=A0A0M3KGL4_ANISI|nr:unnamed protein product [Anisakis simplex]
MKFTHLQASSSNEVKISEENKKDESLELPKNIRLDDETLLESVSIVDEDGVDSHNEKALDFVQLACILARCAFEMSTQHNDAIAFEKASAYIDKVLSNKCNWAIQTSALLRRCAIEKRNKRRVERACSQAELIAKLMDAIDDSSSTDAKQSRNALVLASGLSPSWRVHQLHAEILRSLGCTAEALRIYEKQESWDNVIQCYKSLGQIEKAEHLIRELIGKNPNEPLYYCMLGDITLEPNYYQQAIQQSLFCEER